MFEVTVLGILQGIAEFLPISSSGHLVLAKHLPFMNMGDTGMRIDIFLHVGTLFAIFAFYFSVIRRIVLNLEWSYLFKVIVSAVPAGIVGVTFKDQLEAAFASPMMVGGALAFTGLVLSVTRFLPRGGKDVSFLRAFWMGLAQMVAILPGVSRSGMTLAAARFAKVDAEKSAEFSFLMSAPPIAGAALLDILKGLKAAEPAANEVSWGLTAYGCVLAAVVGYFSLKLLVASLKGRWFWLFGPYCLIVGALTLVLGASGCSPAAEGEPAARITCVQWNIGHFAMGRSSRTTVSPAASAARAAEYRSFIAALDADVIGISEFEESFDTAKTPSRSAVFAAYPHLVAGPANSYQWNALMTRGLPFVRKTVHDYRERSQRVYWLDTVVRLGGRDVHFVQTHLDWDRDGRCVSARRRQIRELVAAFRDVPYVVISGDFNVSYDSEWEPFVKAGFELAVCGRRGHFATSRFPAAADPARTDALDNIIVRGFAIEGVDILDRELKLSDHMVVRAQLRQLPEKKPAPPPATRERQVMAGTEPSLLPEGEWRLVWHDEFNGNRLDDTKWSYRTNFWGRRAKWFAAPEDGAVSVGGGTCRLRVIRRPDGQFVSPQLQTGSLLWDDLGTADKGRFSFWPFPPRQEPRFLHRYGYYECRCRLQRKPGWWSAFWMQAPANGTVLDEESGGVEHDIMESFSPGKIMTHAFHAGGYGAEYHGFNSYRQKGNFESKPPVTLDTETFHRFGLLWEEDGYTVFVDGKPSGAKVGGHADEVVSKVPEFILLTTECKGFRRNGCTGSADPALAEAVAAGDSFEVDYVRVFDRVSSGGAKLP